ncbi:MAG TPA: alpha-amylase family glycosyl hydrolase [Verrucomicrobiae bacterium]|nr:alpha-amylase family glycosyl hydrolase [Verrucomicrobiae bacterium]
MKNDLPPSARIPLRVCLLLAFLTFATLSARSEAMLELFNVSWSQVTAKMPEIAEAGYDSLWLPNPAKGNSGTSSYGYDQFDPFDLGGVNQQGTVATRWGTQSQLIQMVQTAHRFGIRVYFDNVMNHRSSTVPGYPGSGTVTNYYPGLIPQDFHLQTVSGGYNNWPSIGDPYWCTTSVVQNQPLLGLIDLAQEPGTVNYNFGNNVGNTITKPRFVRFPGRTDLYMDTNLPAIGGNYHPFDGNGQPVAEYVQDYLDRAVAWTVYMTKCDGFRLDAVKHVPVGFFGAETGQNDDSSFTGYTGAIQAMYDYVHGYGTNVTGNGYVETDGNRNSLFNTEAPRNDAMIFGEHVSPAPPFVDYLQSGMRLQNQPLYSQLNNSFTGGSSLAGMDGRDYFPNYSNCDGSGNFSAAQAVNFPMNQDYGFNANLSLEDAYLFMREGLPMTYSDGFNHNSSGGTPVVSYANYLGEFSDNSMPDTMYLHNQLARGGTNPRWSDANIIAFERYDYREGTSAQNQGVALCVINTKTSFPGDITFDDGVGQTFDGYYGGVSISNSKNVGLAVGFPPGSVLVQLASSSPTGGRAYQKLLVHAATTSLSAAQASVSASDPTQRLIYVGSQTIPTGGGAIELNCPSGAWMMYGYQWPEASRANVSTNAIILKQGGIEVPHITVLRTDGANGDTNYNPVFPFKMRGSVDPTGNVIGGTHVTNMTYAIDIPVVTNGNFDIIARSDASAVNTLVKLDGGIDLNSQMGLGPLTFNGTAPTNYLDLRDNKPGYATDVYLGYEQAAFQFRNGPEKFAAKNTLSNNIVSLGAETYYYTVSGGSSIVSGAGTGQGISNQTAAFVYHDPAATNTALSPNNTATQRMPFSPVGGQSVDIYLKVGYQFQINSCYLYYTIDGSNPEGAFGTGKGTTQVVQGHFANHDSATSTIDWWKCTIPAQADGTQVRYKVGLFSGGSAGNSSIATIADSESTGSKLYGLTQMAITNFNPKTATVWLHNDLNPSNTVIGLQPGFHIIRTRTFLPRTNQSSVFNTFLQTFYYDGALPTGVIAFPSADGANITGSTYTVVVRADSTVTGVDFNIQDGDPNNDDTNTGKAFGNGSSNGVPVYASATSVTPDATLSAQYPAYPQEFRFVYTNVPISGTATINVRLKEFATAVYPNRLTTLTRTVNTLAPQQIISFASPLTNGVVLTYSTNQTYLLKACFSSSLTSLKTNFNILINGVLQPQSSYILQPVSGISACPGLKAIEYNWNNPPLGTNLIQIIYTNAITPISDVRLVTVAPLLRISGLGNNNQLVIWDSAQGLNYQVLATTNLTLPFAPISDTIPGSGSSTFFYDPNPLPQKFYEIEMVP